MKDLFITKLTLEKVRNLKRVEIPLSSSERKHLIFTGKNGSGKTTVLNWLAAVLDQMAVSVDHIKDAEAFKVEMNCTADEFYSSFQAGNFIIAYYTADRVFTAEVPNHIEKIELKNTYTTQESPRKNFVKYLLDLKMTEALAISSGKSDKARLIKAWFNALEQLLQGLFENPQLKLNFDEDTFRFYISEPGKEYFDFNTLSSGYAAILDIIVDLIMRMEKHSGRKFRFDLPGIVLIDEIETHLHLALQKKVFSLLTTIFPNIQYIVSTHSPFILNSCPNAVIYDLEQKLLVTNGLSDVPYDGIVEGYFKADVLSDQLREKFERYKVLTKKKTLTDDDFEEISNLEMFLDEIPDYLALGISTEYQKIKLAFSNREDIDG